MVWTWGGVMDANPSLSNRVVFYEDIYINLFSKANIVLEDGMNIGHLSIFQLSLTGFHSWV